MSATVVHDEVVAAGRVLFGPAFTAQGPWRGELRSTFRRRALETHPDRAVALGRDEASLAREFHALQEAYAVLTSASRLRIVQPQGSGTGRASAPSPRRAAAAPRCPVQPPAARGRAPRRAPAPAPPPPHRDPAATPLPPRKLRFGEYLYYSGRASFSELVAAVVWQRRQRPNLGDLAIALGYLTPAEVQEILARRRKEAPPLTLFGDFAVSAGYLSPFQRLALVGRQRALQRPIGEFFMERGLLHPSEVDAVKQRIFWHNAACAA